MTIRCDKCGDESNSAPGLRCGRVECDADTGERYEPCTGTYLEMPKQTFVITASVYVDDCETAEEAAEVVKRFNESGRTGHYVEIRLPDPDSGYEWSAIGEQYEEDVHRANPDGSVTLITPSGGEHTYDPDQLRGDELPEPTAKQLQIVGHFRTNERIVDAGGEVTYEMLPDGVMILRSTKDVDGRTRISRVPRDGHYSLVRWED
jgi:hypothetical protein